MTLAPKQHTTSKSGCGGTAFLLFFALFWSSITLAFDGKIAVDRKIQVFYNPNGSTQREPLIQWSTQAQAERFAAWLRKTLRLPETPSPSNIR